MLAQFASDGVFLAFPKAPESPDPIDAIARAVTATPPLAALPAPNYTLLLDQTYHLLKRSSSIDAACRLWEIRLSLMLFSGNLQVARREAINLNNALYLHENPGAERPLRPGTPAGQPNYIYPLPKNNGGEIRAPLLRLLLRLKSQRNLALVNELYKQCYQSRLRAAAPDRAVLQLLLMCLAYEVVAVLFVTKNHLTLVNFLQSLRANLERRAAEPECAEYLSQMLLMHVCAELIQAKKGGKPFGELHGLEAPFGVVSETSLTGLTYIASTIAPLMGGEPAPPKQAQWTLELLADAFAADAVLARTICCVLALWELSAVHQTELTAASFTVTVQPEDDSPLGIAYSIVMSQWGSFVNKLYGME